MKTRKYKDNQQRKNFVQNESKMFLNQYFKKIEKDSNEKYCQWDSDIPLAEKIGFQTKSIDYGKPLASEQTKFVWKYPNSLSTFFLERPSLQSTYLLLKLKDQVSEIVNTREHASKKKAFQPSLVGKTQEVLAMNLGIKELAFQVCYSTKMKQQQNKTRIHGRCIQSNRSRSVSRLLRLSRIRTRTLALEGKITGCARSTW